MKQAMVLHCILPPAMSLQQVLENGIETEWVLLSFGRIIILIQQIMTAFLEFDGHIPLAHLLGGRSHKFNKEFLITAST